MTAKAYLDEVLAMGWDGAVRRIRQTDIEEWFGNSRGFANASLSADQKEQFARATWLINNVKNDLSGKQAKFVETVIKLLSNGLSLTDKQAGWLTGLCDIHGYRS